MTNEQQVYLEKILFIGVPILLWRSNNTQISVSLIVMFLRIWQYEYRFDKQKFEDFLAIADDRG